MPDSFPFPLWGPPPSDERDLDSLLAGKTDVPVALRPVAETLSALRAAPSPGELRAEDFIRAQFRAAGRSAQRQAGQAAHTLEMPAVPPGPGPRRRRGRRRGPVRPRARGWVPALVAGAAVIVLGAAVTYTGNLPGPVQRIAHDTIAAPSAKTVSGGATGGVQARSARPAPARTRPADSTEPTALASPSSTPDKTALCDSFLATMERRGPGQQPWWQTPQYKALSAAAGVPQHVYAYCAQAWTERHPYRNPEMPAYQPRNYPRQPGFGNASGQEDQGVQENQENQQQAPGMPRPGGADGMAHGVP